MSVEAFSPFERANDFEKQIRGVEAAAKSIIRLRLLIAEHDGRLTLERAEKVLDLAMIKHLTDMIAELAGELADALAFLEEFDPLLYQKMKDNS